MHPAELRHRIIAVLEENALIQLFAAAMRRRKVRRYIVGRARKLAVAEKLVEQQATQRLCGSRIARKQRPLHDFGQISKNKDRAIRICNVGLKTRTLRLGERLGHIVVGHHCSHRLVIPRAPPKILRGKRGLDLPCFALGATREIVSLDAIVQASLRVKSTRSRKAKTQALADGLRAVSSNETRIAAMYLAGELPQGKIGVGYAKVMALKDVPAASSTGLSLAHVDRVMTEVKAQKGAGSNERRLRALSDLLQAATLDEQHFLRRLWVGEIRQGALQSLVIDAIAHASELPADRVRRAQMVAGDLGAIATAALSDRKSVV